MIKPNILVIDIETDTSEDVLTYQPEFEPDARLKDEEKIKQSIFDKQLKWQRDCALDPMTGQVCAIGYGYYFPEGSDTIDIQGDPTGGNEAQILKLFWKRWREHNGIIIGHNILQFDLPYLYLRSLKHGIIPEWKATRYNETYTVIDTMDLWNANRYPKQRISLNNLAKFFGLGGKSMTGDKFASMYRNSETREEATEYLKNDLKLTYQSYLKFNI